MKVYEIKNLDCSKKEHRKILVLAVVKEFKLKEKPYIDKLTEICKVLKKRYGMKLRTFPKNEMFEVNMASIETKQNEYITFDYQSKYECLCKYALLVKSIKETKV